MKRILAMICLTVFLIGSFSVMRAEGASTSMRLFGAGKYVVGENFEAAEYVLTAAEQVGSFVVSTDAEGLDVISEGSFDGNTILMVESGDYLELIECVAVNAEDYFAAFGNELSEYGGMLKAGANLLPGVYELVGETGKMSGYRIYQDARFRLVEEEDAFEESCQVHVSEGQYLELIYCALGELISADDKEQMQGDSSEPLNQSEGDQAKDSDALIINAGQTPIPRPERLPRNGQESKPEENSSSPEQEATRKPAALLSTATPMPAPTQSPTPTATPTAAPTQAPTAAPVADQILDITETAHTVPEPKQEEPEDQQNGNKPEETEIVILDLEPAAAPEPAQKVRIDKARTPAIRSIPSTHGEKIGMAEAGAEYVLLETEGKWYKIRLENGAEGWITSGMAEIIE